MAARFSLPSSARVPLSPRPRWHWLPSVVVFLSWSPSCSCVLNDGGVWVARQGLSCPGNHLSHVPVPSCTISGPATGSSASCPWQRASSGRPTWCCLLVLQQLPPALGIRMQQPRPQASPNATCPHCPLPQTLHTPRHKASQQTFPAKGQKVNVFGFAD